MEDLAGFQILHSGVQIVGLLAVVLVFYWICSYASGGFSFSGAGLFNWHPLFMTIGMIYLLGNALLVFRVLRDKPKPTLKLIHTTINVIAFLFAIFGLLAVYVNHNQNNYANFYTLHSWIGLVAIICYFLQGVAGYTSFLFPGLSSTIRAWLMPRHVYFGHFIFATAIAAALVGINEKAIWSLSGNYAKLVPQALLLNFIGLLFLIFGGLVVYISTNIYYKRYPRAAESELVRTD